MRRSSVKLARRTTGVDSEPLRLLLIEDNARHAQLLQDLMGTAGSAFAGAAPYELTHVATMAAGVERLAGGGIDLVLLDLSLPDSTGLDSVMRVRERGPDVPIVALLALNDAVPAEQVLQAGAQDYLRKGQLTGGALARSVRYAVQVSRLELALRSRSLIDGLTGVHNRRGFLALAETHMKLARRMKGRFLIVSADIKALGEINAIAGYDEGDAVLREVAELLKRTFRDSDLVARLDGSAFAAIAVDAPLENSAIIANRLAQHVQAFNGMTLRRYTLQVPVGFSQFDHTSPLSILELLALAVEDRSSGGRGRRTSRNTESRLRF